MGKLDHRTLKAIRKCKLQFHCAQISISNSISPGTKLLAGYGAIKVTRTGTLMVELICNFAAPSVNFQKDLPENLFVAKDRLKLTATLLDGTLITATGFRIRFHPLDQPNIEAIILRFVVPEISISSQPTSPADSIQVLYLECNEDFTIPRNVWNKKESSLGQKSFSWNQTSFEIEKIKLDIVRQKNYTFIRAAGEEFSFDELENAILFYLGFTSGVLPQPYYSSRTDTTGTHEKIISIRRELISKSMPKPIHHAVYDENHQSLDKYHFELLNNIWIQNQRDFKVFESIYSQWKRVWHAFLSIEFSVPALTLSVAIEGLLNDIFIPTLLETAKDENFEETKIALIEKINSLDSISKEHKKSLASYVEKWGNVYAKRALSLLADRAMISTAQVKAWDSLRNSSAHPRLLNTNEARKIKEMNRIALCLGLFYRLVLNVFAYRGAQYSYEFFNDEELVQYEYVPVLSNFSEIK